jgi:hypothetical protein
MLNHRQWQDIKRRNLYRRLLKERTERDAVRIQPELPGVDKASRVANGFAAMRAACD